MPNPSINTTTVVATTDTSFIYTEGITSVFYNHGLKPIHQYPILTNVPSLYWPTALLLLVFGIYVSIKIIDPKKISKISMSIFNIQIAKQLIREDYKIYKRVSVLLSICFVLVFSFLLYKTNDRFDLILKGAEAYIQYLFFISLVTLIYTTKIIFIKLSNFLTQTYDLGNEYILTVFLHSQVLGIFLFPFVVCVQFSQYPIELFLYPSLVITSLFFLFRWFRGFVISSLEQNSGLLYIILYFCALEILPLFVLIKFLLINF